MRAPIRSVRRPASGAVTMITTVEGRKRIAGLERRVAEDVLHVERHEEEHREHRERDDERDRRWRPGTCGCGRSANSTIGKRHAPLDEDEGDEPERRDSASRRDDRGRAPAPGVALDQRQHERAEADGERARRRRSRPCAATVGSRDSRGREQRDDDRGGGDREVEEEDRAPAHLLGEEAADHRADRERERGDAGPGADRLAALVRAGRRW